MAASKAKAKCSPKGYATTNKKLMPIDEPRQLPKREPEKEETKGVADRRDIKRCDNSFHLAPETIAHLIAHKRGQALENKHQQITTLVSKAFHSWR